MMRARQWRSTVGLPLGYPSGGICYSHNLLRERIDLVRTPSALFAIAATALVSSACSGVPQSSSAALPQTGMAPSSVGLAGGAHPNVRRLPLSAQRVLYVTNYGASAVDVVHYGWGGLSTITNGISYPQGDWVDSKGNLYVANYGGDDVTEYSSSGNLTYTYPDISYGRGVEFVTTTRSGTVYEDDFSGYVNEFAQGATSPSATCSLPNYVGYGVGGVALDKSGDVFVDYSGLNPSGQIIEFPHGLTESGCTGTVLPITLDSPGGMVIDKQGNLVAAAGSAVDIIAPPYTSITGTLGMGWENATAVTIDKPGTQAYVTDYGASTVTVLTYPGGSIVGTIGEVSNPWSAVYYKSYVP
jgi:hypothetical protein